MCAAIAHMRPISALSLSLSAPGGRVKKFTIVLCCLQFAAHV